MNIQDFTFEFFKLCLDDEQIKILMNLIRLQFYIIMVSHFFACLWVLIGQFFYETESSGWIQAGIENEIIQYDFLSVYISAFYWVITTFTSVGYGDIVGANIYENLYQMLVEMVGIGFFGYMIGTFQTLIASMGSNDHFTEIQEKLDHNLMRLDKSIKDRILEPEIYIGVKDFYMNKYKYEAMEIQATEFY